MTSSLKCVECGSVEFTNVGTTQNPLCIPCHNRIAEAYGTPTIGAAAPNGSRFVFKYCQKRYLRLAWMCLVIGLLTSAFFGGAIVVIRTENLRLEQAETASIPFILGGLATCCWCIYMIRSIDKVVDLTIDGNILHAYRQVLGGGFFLKNSPVRLDLSRATFSEARPYGPWRLLTIFADSKKYKISEFMNEVQYDDFVDAIRKASDISV